MKMKETKDLKFYEVEYETTHKKIVGIPDDQTINHRDLIKKHIYPFWCNWGRSGVVVKEGGTSGSISGLNINPVEDNKKYRAAFTINGSVSKTVDYVVEASSEEEARDLANELAEEEACNMNDYDGRDWDYVIEVDSPEFETMEEV
jgi:hypothetical protein